LSSSYSELDTGLLGNNRGIRSTFSDKRIRRCVPTRLKGSARSRSKSRTSVGRDTPSIAAACCVVRLESSEEMTTTLSAPSRRAEKRTASTSRGGRAMLVPSDVTRRAGDFWSGTTHTCNRPRKRTKRKGRASHHCFRSATVPPDARTRSAGAMGKLWWGVPAAAQTTSYCRRSRSTYTGRGRAWPKGGVPPMT